MKYKFTVARALFIATMVFFVLSGNNAQGQELTFPEYGSGKIQVRLYTDYFCPPCRRMEPAVEPVLKDLIKRGVIRLTLVDTPYSRHSPLYARYFLYALKGKNDLEQALKVRNILFETAGNEDALTKERLEEILKSKVIYYRPFDVKPVFDRFNVLIKEDHIDATPTCVIIKNGRKEAFTGRENIVNALKRLR
jgi:thiol:disulfide interchange protein DsbA